MNQSYRRLSHNARCRRVAAVFVFSFLAVCGGTPALAALTITPTFDSSITSDPNAAAIETVINNAITAYQSTFSDPINVTITFQEKMSGLGTSSWWYYNISYQTFINDLIADQSTTDDV